MHITSYVNNDMLPTHGGRHDDIEITFEISYFLVGLASDDSAKNSTEMELEGVEQFSKYISHSVNDVVQKYMSSYTIYTCIISAAITLVAVIGSLIFTLRKPRRSSSEGSQPKPETSHKQGRRCIL